MKKLILTVISAILILTSCAEAPRGSYAGVPNPVALEAERFVDEMYETRKSDYNVPLTDARVENLRLAHTYPDFDGRKLDAYVFDYKFKTDAPESLLLAGGMYLAEDGWFCPDYDNSHYLIFEGDEFVTEFGSNDSAPGEALFDSELAARIAEIVPTAVAREAERVVVELYKSYDSETVITDARVENLRLAHTYADFDGRKLDAYVFDYKFKTDAPESLILAGGMYLAEDGWFCPDYDNSHYLIFAGDEFVTSHFANDCSPGNELFDYELGAKLYDLGFTDVNHREKQLLAEIDRWQSDFYRYSDANLQLQKELKSATESIAQLELELNLAHQIIGVLLTEPATLPDGEPLLEAHTTGWTINFRVYSEQSQPTLYWQSQSYFGENWYKAELELPEEYKSGRIVRIEQGGGSGEAVAVVEATNYSNETVRLAYTYSPDAQLYPPIFDYFGLASEIGYTDRLPLEAPIVTPRDAVLLNEAAVVGLTHEREPVAGTHLGTVIRNVINARSAG